MKASASNTTDKGPQKQDDKNDKRVGEHRVTQDKLSDPSCFRISISLQVSIFFSWVASSRATFFCTGTSGSTPGVGGTHPSLISVAIPPVRCVRAAIPTEGYSRRLCAGAVFLAAIRERCALSAWVVCMHQLCVRGTASLLLLLWLGS